MVTMLPSKVEVPSLGGRILNRPLLRQRLQDALRGRITLVVADAGFGKSTLLADFLAHTRQPAVWYRVDASDNDPASFATHLLHGLRPHIPAEAYRRARQGLALASSWNAAIQLVGLAMHRLRHDLVIVLDDLHLIHGPDMTTPMTGWIDGLPSRAHLAILSRVVPPFPLARRQTRGELTIFGPDDLRFRLPELRELLIGLHGLPLTEEALQILADRTEGWAAGVMLVLHSATTQGAAPTAQALSTVSGSSREIYDYLAQEAFMRQPIETQRFLLATAAVDRFTLALATALLSTTTERSGETLDHLESNHLFIVPLDREHRWYRYHHLFQEFLRRIGTDRDPEWIRAIHLAAARWWEDHGEVDQAVHHLITAEDFPRAATLVAAAGVEMVPQGRIETVRRWLEHIPPKAWDAAPRLYLIQGLIGVISGAAGEPARFLEEARRRLRDRDPEGEMYALRWLINSLIWQGGLDLMAPLLSSIADVDDRQAQVIPTVRAVGKELGARVAMLQGDLSTAERLFDEAVGISRASGDEWTYLGCVRYQTEASYIRGHFQRAVAQCEELLALTRRRNWWHEHAHLHVEAALALLTVGSDEEADRHLTEARGLLPTIPCRVLAVDLAITSAQAAIRKRASDLAEAELREVLGGERATHYRAFRYDAQRELALLLVDTAPEEARSLASTLLKDAEHFGAFRAARGLLAAAIVTGSYDLCTHAAERFEDLGAEPWHALARLHAVTLGTPDHSRVSADAAAAVLHRVREETWQFLFAQAPPGLLARFATDPVVGLRIRRALEAALAAARPRIAIRCLGTFEMARNRRTLGRDIWKRAAPRRLLQFLLLQDRPMHREEITEALWPSQEPSHAANQLRVALSQLRGILEPDLVSKRSSNLILTPGSTVVLARDRLDTDLDRFRAAIARAAASSGTARRAALEETVALYTGDLFADSPFEDWVGLDRERLRNQWLAAIAALAELDESAADYEAAIRWWQAVVDRDPAAEQAYRGLMRCYRALGRVSDAVRAFDACRRALAELGAAPSVDTVALQHSLQLPDREPPRVTPG